MAMQTDTLKGGNPPSSILTPLQLPNKMNIATVIMSTMGQISLTIAHTFQFERKCIVLTDLSKSMLKACDHLYGMIDILHYKY